MTRAVVLVALLALSACSTTSWTRVTSSIEASRLVREADAQLREGHPSAAARILEEWEDAVSAVEMTPRPHHAGATPQRRSRGTTVPDAAMPRPTPVKMTPLATPRRSGRT